MTVSDSYPCLPEPPAEKALWPKNHEGKQDFHDDSKTIRSGIVEKGFAIFGARVTLIQIRTMVIAALILMVLALVPTRTRIGLGIRAVACSPSLAMLAGIDSERVVVWTFAIGSALAGIAGILRALGVDMLPTMGMNPLMMGVVAVIVGGGRSIAGITLAGLLLGMAEHLGAWIIGTEWQDAVALLILNACYTQEQGTFFPRKFHIL